MSNDPALTAAIDYWTSKLWLLDRAITTNSGRSTLLGVRRATERLREQRDHLAVLLRLAGVDVKELDEEKSNG